MNSNFIIVHGSKRYIIRILCLLSGLLIWCFIIHTCIRWKTFDGYFLYSHSEDIFWWILFIFGQRFEPEYHSNLIFKTLFTDLCTKTANTKWQDTLSWTGEVKLIWIQARQNVSRTHISGYWIFSSRFFSSSYWFL